MTNIGAGRPLRVCDLCGGVDDHPRHVIAGPVGAAIFDAPDDGIINAVIANAPTDLRARLISDLLDPATRDRHLDCCAAAGCPLDADDPASCGTRTAGAAGKTGANLLAHLEG